MIVSARVCVVVFGHWKCVCVCVCVTWQAPVIRYHRVAVLHTQPLRVHVTAAAAGRTELHLHPMCLRRQVGVRRTVDKQQGLIKTPRKKGHLSMIYWSF